MHEKAERTLLVHDSSGPAGGYPKKPTTVVRTISGGYSSFIASNCEGGREKNGEDFLLSKEGDLWTVGGG